MSDPYYGVKFADGIGQLAKELHLFRHCDREKDYTGPGRYQHARMCVELMWRKKGHVIIQWHPDFDTALDEFCNSKGETLVTGPAAAGKTMAAAVYALLFWMSDPLNSGVIVTSTTLGGLKKRIWGEIRKLYANARQDFGGGNLVDSLTALQTEKGDMQRGIFGIAVAEGNEGKALGRIIGFHPKSILVVVDELTDVSWAIIDALTNLFTGKVRSQFIGIGNASSIFDSHGKLCEPKDGWSSVNVNSERWETKRGGICLHFDGTKNINVTSGETKVPFLLTQANIDKTTRDYGENSPQFWRFLRGFWCPEGTVKSVLSESLIQKFQAMDKAEWREGFIKIAALDPAFEGGDRCILRFGRYGLNTLGINALMFDEILTVKLDLTSKQPIHFQIAHKVREECIERKIAPENFAMDTSGEGGGLASIISEEWSPAFHRVEFGGKASELPASPTDSRLCCDVYYNKVCELWFSFRVHLIAGQIRGLDAETAVELCSRLYFSEAKIKLESKSDMRLRLGGRSPDMADACVVAVDLVKHKGGFGVIPSRARGSTNRAWENLVKEFELDDETEYQHEALTNVQ